MGQGAQALGDRPEPIEAQRIHGQAAERGHDLNAVDLAVAVRVFLELRVAEPVPGVLNRPAVAHVLQQRPNAGAEAGDTVTGFVDGLAVATALAADRENHCAIGPVLRHPLRSRHAPHRPGEVAAAFVLVLAGLQRRLPSVDQSIYAYLKPLAAAMFHRDQEVGITLFEVDEKGRFACSASACTSSPSSSTRSWSWRRAAISPPASVAYMLWAIATPRLLE